MVVLLKALRVADPVNPVDPTSKTGDGKSFLERMQRGMSNDPNANPEKAKQFADFLEKSVNEGKAINQAKNAYTKNYSGNTRVGGIGGDGGDLEKGMMGSRFKPLNKAKGGKIKSASARADGIAQRGKTRA